MQISTSLLALAAVIAAATALPAEAGALPKSNKSFAPQRNAAARPKQVSQTDQFCQKFTAECYNQALHGKTGKVKVVHACRRNGKQFTFGCKAGQTTLTKHVLAKLDAASVSTVIVPTATTVTSTTETVSYTAQETTTSTIASLGDQPIPVVQYVITGNQALGRRAIDKRTTSKPPGRIDNSNFCTAYTAACKRQCARRSSTPRAEVCHLSSISGSRYKYDLSCFCKNGWVETQHALADLGNSVSIAKVSTVKTSTSTITTSSAVATTTATSTTNVILAPTGSIKAVNRDDGTDVGYVTFDTSNPNVFGKINPTTTNFWMAVLDPTSGLYALQLTDGSGYFFSGEAGNSGSNWNTDASGYMWSQLDTPAAPAGPASGSGNLGGHRYESYIFSPVVNTTATPAPNTLAQLNGVWINDNGTRSANPVWINVPAANGFFLWNDIDSVNSRYGFTPQGQTALNLYLVS